MKRKTIIFIIVISTSIPACFQTSTDNSHERSIPVYLDNNAVMSNGRNFINGAPIVLNNTNGREVKPCGDIILDNNKEEYDTNKTDKSKQKCKTQTANLTSKLRLLINSSGEVIEGSIIIDGKKVKAKYISSISAFYEGSDCEIFYSGGNQYELCTSLEKKCSVFSKYDEPRRSRYNAKCSEFPFW